MSPKAEQRANFPLRGKSRVAGIGVHFQRAAGAVVWFSLPPVALPPIGGIQNFAAKGGDTTTLGPKARQTLEP